MTSNETFPTLEELKACVKGIAHARWLRRRQPHLDPVELARHIQHATSGSVLQVLEPWERNAFAWGLMAGADLVVENLPPEARQELARLEAAIDELAETITGPPASE